MGVRALSISAIGVDLASVLPDDNIPWYKKPHLVRLNFGLLSMFLFSSANGYDGSMMNGLQALEQWQDFMHKPTGAWLGFVNAVGFIAAIAIYPGLAWSNNRFGRKVTISFGYAWLLVGTVLQTAATSPGMFVAARLCIGGVGACFVASAPLLIAETAYPTHRGPMTALYNCGWYVGSLIAAWATFGTRNYTSSWAWRVPSILQALIPVVALPGYLMHPESPRWLVSRGRIEEARAFLVKYHAGGDESSPLAEYELQEISRTLAMEADNANSTTWADMFRTKGNRHRSFITITLGIFAQWNGVGVASYYLAPVLKTVGVTSVTQQTMISGFLQVWNLILAVSAAFSVDRVGRKKLFMTSCIGMLLCYIVISACSGSFAHTGKAATGTAVIPFLFLFYGFYDIAFTPLLVSYTCEIWPYQLRSRGLSMMASSTTLAVFFNIFVNPIALDSIKWKYYVVYCIILVGITLTVYFFYPETKGHSLENMSTVFDGENAHVPTGSEVREAVTERVGSVQAADIKANDMIHVEKLK